MKPTPPHPATVRLLSCTAAGFRDLVTMPMFIDTHANTSDLPAELRKKISDRVKSGEKDKFGVVDKGVIIDKEGRKLHCVLDAPDAEAVRKHHETLNVSVESESIHRADVIMK